MISKKTVYVHPVRYMYVYAERKKAFSKYENTLVLP